jgi:CRP-like cAMP-binding protein
MARPTADGQDVLLDFLGPGDHFGSLASLGDAEYREDITAQTSCCILYTTAETFDQLLGQYPVVALSALEIVAARLRQAQTAIEQLSAYPVEHRVAATLLLLAEKRGTPDEDGVLIEMPISRQDIADMTGAKVETVSRIMSDLRRSGVIESGRRWVAVRDMRALHSLVGNDMGAGKSLIDLDHS